LSFLRKTGEPTDLKDMKVVSFAFLAFQNGFFWQAVLDAAHPAKATAAVAAMREGL